MQMRISSWLAAFAALTSVWVSDPQAQAQAQPSVQGEQTARVKLHQPILVNLPPLGGDMAKQYGLSYLLAQRTTDYHHASLSQTKNIELVARRLNGTVIEPNTTFSYYKQVGPYTANNGFHWGRAFAGDRIVPSMGGGVCQGASTLYSALLLTGLPVVERHPHSLMVPYLPPGEDATVAGTYLNFKFRNNQDQPVVLAATADTPKRRLTIAIWGAYPAPKITVHHKILATYPYRVVRQCTASDPDNNMHAPGQPGVKVQSWLEIHTPDGMQTKSLGEDTYRPSPRVERLPKGSTGCPKG